MQDESRVLIDALRHDDIGANATWFPAFGEESPLIPMTFHEHCISAFYLSLKSLSDLENSSVALKKGDTSIVAVGMWFIAIEAYINSILRICCFFRGEPFEPHAKSDIGTRLVNLIGALGFEKREFYSSGVFQKLEEFKCFRNEIFHDRAGTGDVSFKKTAFCSNPLMANQVDVMQAAIIALEIFNCFRLCLRGLELMPNIVVHKEDSFFHCKYDILYRDVMEPLFSRSLKKHGLESCLKTQPIFFNFSDSKICEMGEVTFIIRAEQQDKFKFKPNSEITNISEELLGEIRTKEIFDTKTQFKLGSYIRR